MKNKIKIKFNEKDSSELEEALKFIRELPIETGGHSNEENLIFELSDEPFQKGTCIYPDKGFVVYGGFENLGNNYTVKYGEIVFSRNGKGLRKSPTLRVIENNKKIFIDFYTSNPKKENYLSKFLHRRLNFKI